MNQSTLTQQIHPILRRIYALLLCSFAFLASLTITSCEATDDSLNNTNRVVAVFTPQITDQVSTPDSPATSRASGTTWDASDQIGIYMMKSGEALTASNLSTNIPYTISTVGSTVSLVPVNANETIYYPADGGEVNFVAYYPWQTGVTTDYTVNVSSDNQQSQADIDLLYARNTSAYSQYDAGATLTFTHQLSKVIVNIDRGSNLASTSISGLTSTITGSPNTAGFALANGTLTANATSSDAIAFLKSHSANTRVVFEAILIPHNNENYAGRTFVFTLGETTYTYPVTQDFTAGSKYTYNLVVSNSGISLREINISDWEGGDVAWDGKYTLTTSTNTVEFLATTSSQQIRNIAVKTKGSAVVPKVSSKPDWLTAPSLDVATGVDDWNVYTLTLTSSATNTGELLTGIVELSFESLTVSIAVSQQTDLANCYIVAPGASLTFPVTRAYAGGVLASDYADGFTVEKLWDDNSVLSPPTVTGNGKAAQITVTTSPSNPGNALVVLKDKNNVIVWSYHIWVIDYNPNIGGTWTPKAGSTNPRCTFMDRNLGATANTLSLAGRGLYYQWGRKDPFPANNISGTHTVTYGTMTIAASIQNPGGFQKTGSNSRYNWHVTHDPYLWCTADGQKTIYDPCPAGWRVPTSGDGTDSPWYGLEAQTFTEGANAGVNWGVNADWCAAGCRAATEGNFSNDNTNKVGQYWAATSWPTTPSRAHMMIFRSGSMSPEEGGAAYQFWYNSKAAGLPVRCVAQ